MRELHVVAVSDDGRHVVLATGKGAAKGSFRVALDDRLAAAVRGDLARPGEDEPAVVTPKEIQARLRAGESPEQIAQAAGVPLAKVERYAGPVLSERERVLTQARAGFVSRSRLGASALPLGEAVDRHLADTTGVRLETVEWSARREDAGTWLVELRYVSQARRRTAAWRYDVARREVTATDSASAALAHVEPGRKHRPVEPAPAAAPRATRRTRAQRPVASASTGTRTVTARPAAPQKARPAAAAQAAKAPTKAPAKAPAKATKAPTRATKAPTKAAKAPTKAAKAPSKAAPAAAAPREQAPEEPTAPPTLRVVGADEPAPVRGPKPPPAAARTTPPRAAGQRASLSGWADVLLSTAPRDDDPDQG